MDKQQIVSFIEGQLASGKISKEDLVNLAQGVQVSQPQSSYANVDVGVAILAEQDNSRNIIHTFYIIGAIIAVVGVVVLLFQNWDEIGFIGRILVTLGIFFVTYVTGLFLKNPEQRILSQVMFTISAVLAPMGTYVLLTELGVNSSWSVQLTIQLIWFVIFGIALFISKRNILVPITVGFASLAYYTFVLKVLGNEGYYNNSILMWSFMLLGASHILIGYGYQMLWPSNDQNSLSEKKATQNLLYGFGSVILLGSGMSIGGMFDLFFIILIFGAFYGGVYLKSRSMFILGAFFLMAHIIKLTTKYFVYSVGWPVALIASGFAVIGVGYFTFYLSKKYFSTK
jgi:hypothetical protein